MTKKAILLTVAVTAVMLTGALCGAPVSRAITVGPVRLEYYVQPGQTVTGTITLLNEQAGTETLYPSFEKFTENNNEKVFSTEEPNDLASWFSTVSSVTLKSQQQQAIPFTIAVPKNAAPGGHFAVMWWGTASPHASSTQQVSIVTRAGVLIYMTVAGDIQEGGSMQSFSLSSPAGNVGPFFFGYPLIFSPSFFNKGNIYERPEGGIKIYNMLGMLSADIPVNHEGANVLPQSVKSFPVAWESNPWAFGIYHAVVTLTYGQNSEVVSQSLWFFVLPFWTTVWVIIVLILVFLVAPLTMKRYNRWIIHQASKKRES